MANKKDISLDLHQLRRRMEARDKALIAEKSYEEAVKLVKEKYGTSQDSAEAFVAWQRTIASGGQEGVTCKPNEKWHLKWDEYKGEWVKVPQPGEPGFDPEKHGPAAAAAASS